MQTVFKIDLPMRSEEKRFIPRKAHKKSRGGCLYCKQRRIRCDEVKPSCGKCRRVDSECIYSYALHKPARLLIGTTSQNVCSPTANMYSMAVDIAGLDLDTLLGMDVHARDSSRPKGSLRILQHFQSHTSLTLGHQPCRAVFQSVVASKAWDNTLLMHMVLATASAHLKRLHPTESQGTLYQQYSNAEAAHWHTGLQLYQKLLHDRSSNTELDLPLDFDATLATTFLSIIFTFALDDELPIDAFCSSDEEKFRHAINPLAATAGFRALSDVFGGDITTSTWLPVMLGSDDGKGRFSGYCERSGIDDLPPAFIDLCELKADSDAGNNQYYQIVSLLTPLLQLDRDLGHFTKLIAFGGRTWPHTQPLLYRRDPRGLLLIAYWFALLIRLDQWWLTKRAKSECTAIVHFLSQLRNPKITPLLRFPASFGQIDLGYLWSTPEMLTATSSTMEEKT